MMKYVPRIIKENVNVSETSPIKEFFVLLGGIFGILFLVYFLLGFALDVVVDRMPERLEIVLGEFFTQRFPEDKIFSPIEQELQELLDELVDSMTTNNLSYTVQVVESPEVNALALPGGNIVIFSGLLEHIHSENELAMVLGHELGHFVHRDHLRGLGRGVVLVALSSFLFGVDHSVAETMMNMLITANLKHSRNQEIAADLFALDLVNAKYGHVAGATDFLNEFRGKEKFPVFLKFFSTHPQSTDRISLLQDKIRKKGYAVKEKMPLSKVYKMGEDANANINGLE